MGPDDIVDRVAAGYREAPTFSFTWDAPVRADDAVRSTGALEYDDGEVAALRLRSTDAHGNVTEDYRYVDGTLYSRTSEGRFRVEGDPAPLLEAWDWAQAAGHRGDPVTVEVLDEEEIDGVRTTPYRLTFDGGDIVETWWVDDEDQMRRYESEVADGVMVGELTGYGEDVEITVPADLVDE